MLAGNGSSPLSQRDLSNPQPIMWKEVNRMNREYWDLQPEEVYQDSTEELEIQRELGSAHASTQFSWDSD